MAHPLFPTGLALWFGALFSLSCLAIRGSLLEAAVVASHIDYVLPQASPPLGLTARALLALAVGLGGASIGYAIAARMKATHLASRRARMVPARTVPTPGRPHDPALWTNPYAAPHAPAPMAGPSVPESPRPIAEAPAAGVTARLPIRLRGRDAHPDAPPRAPILAHEELGGEPLGAPAVIPVPEAPFEASATPEPAYLAANDHGPAPEAVEPLPLSLAPAQAAPTVFEPLYPTRVEAVMPRGEGLADASASPGAEPEQREPVMTSAGVPMPEGPTAAERIAEAPLTVLSHVELIERLAIALERGQARGLQAPDHVAPPAAAPTQAEPAPVMPTPAAPRRAVAMQAVPIPVDEAADRSPFAGDPASMPDLPAAASVWPLRLDPRWTRASRRNLQ